MPIKIFSDIDLKGSQIKTARLDNLSDENLLTFNGQIGFDTDDYKLKYYDSISVATIASEEWVMGQSFGVNLLSGNGTTFVDYGTAGQVNLGGSLLQDTTISGLYDLTIDIDKVTISSDFEIVTNTGNNRFVASIEPNSAYWFFQANSAGLGTYIGEANSSYGIANLQNKAFIETTKDFSFTYGLPPHDIWMTVKNSGQVIIGDDDVIPGYKFQVIDGGLYVDAGTSGNYFRVDDSQVKFENTAYNSSFKIDQLGLMTLSSSAAATGTNTIIKQNNLSSGPILQFIGAYDTTTIGIPHKPIDVTQEVNAFYDSAIRMRTGRTDYFRGLEVHVNGAAVAPGTPVHRIGQHPGYGFGGGYYVGTYELDGTNYHPIIVTTPFTRLTGVGLAPATAKLHVKGNTTSVGEIFRLDNNNSETKFLVLDNGTILANGGTNGQSTMLMIGTHTTFNAPVKYASDISPLFDNLTLVTKQYVDTAVAAGTVTVDNGLQYGTSGNAGLGGTLYRDTTISGANTYDLNFNNMSRFEANAQYIDLTTIGIGNLMINHTAPEGTLTGQHNVIVTQGINGAFPIRAGSDNTGFGYNVLSSSGVAASFINAARNTAIGSNVILGDNNGLQAADNVAIGYNVLTSAGGVNQSVFIGNGSGSNALGASNIVAIGYDTQTARSNTNSISIGRGTRVYNLVNDLTTNGSVGTNSIVIGDSSVISNSNNIVLGANAGQNTPSVGSSHISIGSQANSGTSGIGSNSVAIGTGAKSIATNSIAIGQNTGAVSGVANSDSISIGTQANNGVQNIGQYAIAIGRQAKSTGFVDISIGLNAGNNTGTNGSEQISIGYNSNGNTANNIGLRSISIGVGARATADYGVAQGWNAFADGVQAIALGYAAKGKALNSVSIGAGAGDSSGTIGNNAISIGTITNAGSANVGVDSVAIGTSAKAAAAYNIAIGNGAGNSSGTTNILAISIGAGANLGTYDIGQNSIAIGTDTISKGDNSISVGFEAGDTTGTVGVRAISMGFQANAGTANIGQSSIAIGSASKASNTENISIGVQAGSTTGTVGTRAISMGYNSNEGTLNIGDHSVAIGTESRSTLIGAVAIGYQAGNTSGTHNNNSISIGYQANQGTANIGINGISIGTGSEGTNDNAVAIGAGTSVTGLESIAIGSNTKALADYAVALGRYAGFTSGTYGQYAISIGYNANQGSANIGGGAIAIGASSKTKANQSISIGSGAGATTGTDNNTSISFGYFANGGSADIGQNSIAFGSNTVASTNSSIAIGNGATAIDTTNGGANIAIGVGAGFSSGSTFSNSISIGYQTNTGSLNIGQYSVAIGSTAHASTLASVAIGQNAGNNTGTVGVVNISIGNAANFGTNAIGQRSVAIGDNVKTKGSHSIAIGTNAGDTTNTDNGSAISIGQGANSGSNSIGAGSIAIGTSTKSMGDGSIAIGTNVQITATGGAIAIGTSASVPGGGSGVAVGQNATAAVEATSIGTGSSANFNSSTALGFSAAATGGTKSTRYTAVGAYAGRNLAATNNIGAEAIMIGPFSLAPGNNAIAIGYQANAANPENIAIGLNATTDNTGSGTIAIGTGTSAVGGGTSIGRTATSNDGASTAIGSNAKAFNSGTALGFNAGQTSGTIGGNAISIGTQTNFGSVNIGTRSIAMGVNNNASGSYAVAIGGQQLVTSGTGAMMFGYSNTTATNAMDFSFALVWQESLPDYHIVKAAQATIDNTPLTLHQYPLADDNVYHMKFTILAVQTNYGSAAGTDRASFTFEALAYRASGGGATLEGGTTFNITEIKSANATPWTATIDVLGNNVRTIVTGVNGENINWKVMLHVTRVS